MIMRNSLLILFSFLLIMPSVNAQSDPGMAQVIDQVLSRAESQSLLLAKTMEEIPDALPRTVDKEGKLVTSNSAWWCSGFFPGTLWYLYENSGNKELEKYAWMFTNRINKEQYNKGTHDLGFMLYCSYGNALRITDVDSCKRVLLNGAASLSSRFNGKVGCIQSWGRSSKWQFPVIIDNMMNLEFLMWAAKASGDNRFRDIAVTHANTTISNHFRPDYSSYHVVSYVPETGKVEVKCTHQGYSDESAWARGQVWGLYGFGMMYRETRDKRYLDQAKRIAAFLMNHPNMPADKIPYWDFNAPDIPNALRDASAAAIMASSLIELSQFVEEPLKQDYLAFAESQLRTLASPQYLAETGTNGCFILKHGVGHLPGNSEVDVPLTYGDYYFVEALLRYRKLVLHR